MTESITARTFYNLNIARRVPRIALQLAYTL